MPGSMSLASIRRPDLDPDQRAVIINECGSRDDKSSFAILSIRKIKHTSMSTVTD